MQVLYIGGFNLPDKNAAAQRVVANAKMFRELGYNVTLVGITRDMDGLEPFVYQGFQCVNLRYPDTTMGWLKMLASIKQYLPFYKEDTKIVVAYNHPAAALNKLLKYNQKRGIVTLSDCTEWYEPEGGWLHRIIKGWDVNRRMYKVQCKLDGIISISKYLDEFYKNRGVTSFLLPPLVDKEDVKWKHHSNENKEKISILYAGSPGGSKDKIDYIINALEKASASSEGCKPFELNVIGITEEQYRKVYLNGDRRTLPKFASFLGRVPHQEVIKRLIDADFQIFLREDHLANKAGFPTKFAETISAGTLILTNASSNIKDYMIEGVNSYELDISSEDALVKSLIKPLSLSKQEIIEKKMKIDSDVFDYRRYIADTHRFLLEINNENNS